ncbi:hypothetical protein LPJ56_004494, partial [Coemansia sp. RSA 2599]
MAGPQYGSRRAPDDSSRPALGLASADAENAAGNGNSSGVHLASAADAGTTIDQVSQSVIDGFVYGVPYLRLNTSILVACHSEDAMASNLFSEEASVVYSDACYHDLQDPAARDSLDPHVFELVADAYAHVRRL